MTREGGVRCLCMWVRGTGIRDVLLNDINEQWKITSTGLKLFERQDAKVCCPFRHTSHLSCCMHH